MAQVLSPIPSVATQSTIRAEPRASQSLELATAFSPVDERGTFMHDKIFKEAWLHQRTRKTKNWKARWYVLRGSVISVYKNDSERKLHRQIQLSDLTACAILKDAKRPNVFGLFSPARNYHLQAANDKEMKEWVDLIRRIASLEDEDDPIVMSPTSDVTPIPIPDRSSRVPGPSSPTAFTRDGRVGSFTLDYSGASMSSTSELGGMVSQSSLAMGAAESNNSAFRPTSSATAASTPGSFPVGSPIASNAEEQAAVPEPGVQRKESGLSNFEAQLNESRVIWHGYLYVLKSKSGIRQWKKIWVVIRPHNIVFYKNDDEYRAIKLIPLESVIDIVEINPVSKSKQHCMQLIMENKSYRFSAGTEENLTKWLGSLKSTLAKSRKSP